jgi:hypothetical protein
VLNIQKQITEPFVKQLSTTYKRTYGLSEPHFANIIEWSGYFALENIANCDALYHNVEHTIMVTLAGQEIIRGKHLIEGGVSPSDWLHFLMALLCHDIGYVKGICRDDKYGCYASGTEGKMIKLDEKGTCAALAPWHVDRGKLFVRERFQGNLIMDVVETERLNSYIEMTRFPVPGNDAYMDTKGYPGLLRAADFIGQLGDPDYLRKIPALFYEFEETGANKEAGYKNPGDMRRNYAKFYWNVVQPYIKDAMRYLRVTQEGKQWISNLHSHVFTVEHDQ